LTAQNFSDEQTEPAPATVGFVAGGAPGAAQVVASVTTSLGEAVLESLPNHIAVLDAQGRIVRVNQAWRDFLLANGVPGEADAYLGTAYLDVCGMAAGHDIEETARVHAGVGSVLRGEQAEFVTDYVHNGQPAPRWFELRASRLATVDGVVVSHLDITRRKRAEIESANRLNELARVCRAVSMGALAGSAAHELSQPLTAILSNAQAAIRFMAMDPPNLDLVREILADIASADQRAGEIIRRIRRLLNKGEPSEREEIDLNDVVRESMQMLADEALLRKVRISVLREPELPRIAGDSVQLQQVLLNLVLNAFDAMDTIPSDERQPVVRTARRGNNAVELAVHDRGSGVGSAQFESIFDPFYTTKHSGMGMGLYITRAIVESHGGEITASPGPEVGLRVTVTLPVAGVLGEYDQSPIPDRVPDPEIR